MTPAMTKMIVTISPVSDDEETIRDFLKEGVRIFRINLSHGTSKQHENSIRNIRKVSGEMGIDPTICLDTRGPEIRIEIADTSEIPLKEGDLVSFSNIRSPQGIFLPVPDLSIIPIGSKIYLDDALLAIEVVKVSKSSCSGRALNFHRLKNNKKICIPGVILDCDKSKSKDKKDLALVKKYKIDVIFASFINSKEEIEDIRKIVNDDKDDKDIKNDHDKGMNKVIKNDHDKGMNKVIKNDHDKGMNKVIKNDHDKGMNKVIKNDHDKGIKPSDINANGILIYAKIETLRGVENADEIIKASDGIMIARGDLGVEMTSGKMFSTQKILTKKCQKQKKPVICATQMLETMIHNPTPSRAEITDTGNAVLDQFDALLLSGETAVGEFPSLTVRTMRKIIEDAESYLFESSDPHSRCPLLGPRIRESCVVIKSSKFETILRLYGNHFEIPLFVVSNEIYAGLNMLRGVIPYKTEEKDIQKIINEIKTKYKFKKVYYLEMAEDEVMRHLQIIK